MEEYRKKTTDWIAPTSDKVSFVLSAKTALRFVNSVDLIAGLSGSVYALGSWEERAFGPLDPTKTLRLVIPASTAITLGFQIILSSFFLSVLGLKRR